MRRLQLHMRRGSDIGSVGTGGTVRGRYTGSMHYTVKILRHRGARRPEREILGESGTDGQLTGAHVGASFELKLSADDGSRQEPIIPVFSDAKLVSTHGDKMMFRGIETDAHGAQFVQEWSVKIVA